MQVMAMGRLFCRVRLEGLTVTALSDGYVDMPASDLTGVRDAAAVVLTDGQLRLQVHTFVVQGAAGTLLIDAGAGEVWEPTLGRLPEALAEAGIDARGIGQIALTHVHSDHFGGLMGAKAAEMFTGVERLLVPVEELGAFRRRCGDSALADRVVPLEQGDGPLPGVIALNAPGHTAGHMGFVVENRMLIWGDVVHAPGVQFAQPTAGWAYDEDGAGALQTRLRLLRMTADDGLLVAGAHLDFPAMGRVARDGAVFRFVPM